ncbi:MAG: hypothetical protein LBG71_01735 [Clostridiales Family XIII bacterium]|jgi:hypothetical protein|nr:hypothetical protein [Clostridiales Family XIII bacterium]
MKKSVFKSPEKRDRMRAYYDGVPGKFPFEQKYVATSFGRTFMLAFGDEAKPPFIARLQ